MKRSVRIALMGIGVVIMAFGNYTITVSALVAPYSLPIFVLTFIVGMAMLAVPFVTIETTISKLEGKIEALRKEMHGFKTDLGWHGDVPEPTK